MSQNLSTLACPVVTVSQVTKRYPGVIANNRIDLALWSGEVHVLLGENGAGKSTLVAILSGLQQPDEGRIAVDGRAETLSSPRRARALGIGTVFQHAMMVPGLSVVDNIALGDPWWQRPARRRYADRVHDIARDIGITVNPFALAGSLSLGELQQAEIVRTLLRGSRVLILDEATAMLTPDNAQELGQLMRRLVSQGLAVVFITHKLNEALAWGDRISVLRRGSKVGEIGPERLKVLTTRQATQEVVEMMFSVPGQAGVTPGVISGEPVPAARFAAGAIAEEPVSPAGTITYEPVLQTRVPAGNTADATAFVAQLPAGDVQGKPVLEAWALAVDDPLVPVAGIGLSIRAGEIVGIAGIDGNGQKQLAEALAGQRPLAAGRLSLCGESIEHCGIGQRRRRGLRYVTDDRLGEGTVGTFPVSINLLLKQIGDAPFWRRGIVQPAAIARHALARIIEYDIRTPAIDTPLGKLSGGNIQKALLARELSGQARMVIFAKPTHGLDLQNTQSIRGRIRLAAEAGVAVLLISTDLEELLELADRIAVMAQGRIIGMVENTPAARGRIGELMSGAMT